VSGRGAPQSSPVEDGHALRVAVVAALWHEEVMAGLVAGAMRGLEASHVTNPDVVRVPGAFELPVVAARLARAGHDAIVALGVVIRGRTPHFQ